MADVEPAVSLCVVVEEGRAVIRCGRCGVEQVLWTRTDLAAEGLATLFTNEHLSCTPMAEEDSVHRIDLDDDGLVVTHRTALDDRG
jgi:hypothetical protein